MIRATSVCVGLLVCLLAAPLTLAEITIDGPHADDQTRGDWPGVYGDCFFLIPNPSVREFEDSTGPDWFGENHVQYYYENCYGGALFDHEPAQSMVDWKIYRNSDDDPNAFAWSYQPEDVVPGVAQWNVCLDGYKNATWDNETFTADPLVVDLVIRAGGNIRLAYYFLNGKTECRELDFVLSVDGIEREGTIGDFRGGKYVWFDIHGLEASVQGTQITMTVVDNIMTANCGMDAPLLGVNSVISGVFVSGSSVCTEPECGNGRLDPGETCDPPGVPAGEPNECRANCTYCGDDIIDDGEECDDGNNEADDGCDPDCRIEVELVCDLDLTLTSDPETIVLQDTPDCENLTEDLSVVTFRYTGEACDPTQDNPQEGKFECTGDPMGADPVRVVVVRDEDEVFPDPATETIAVGDLVTLYTIKDKLHSNTEFEVRQGSTMLQRLKIHTSCSKRLAVGDRFGSMVVVALNGQEAPANFVEWTYTVTNNGDPLIDVSIHDLLVGVVADGLTLASGESMSFVEVVELYDTTTNEAWTAGVGADGAKCGASASATVEFLPPPASCEDGKPKRLVFEYTGEACDPTQDNSQDGKFECTGDPMGAEPVQIVMTADENKYVIDPTDESVNVGDLFSITSVDDHMRSETRFAIKQGGAILQSLNVHTSCSKPLNVGDRFGALILREFIHEGAVGYVDPVITADGNGTAGDPGQNDAAQSLQMKP